MRIVRFVIALEKNNSVFCIDSYKKFKISEQVLGIIKNYIQITKDSLEAGGVMLGRYLWSGNIVIDYITVPKVNDKRRKYYFFRDRSTHQKEIIKKWKQSNGTCNYLGEWHTHPEENPKPSEYDITQWKKMIKNAQYDSDYLFFLIAGRNQIKVWIGFKDGLIIKELSEYEN